LEDAPLKLYRCTKCDHTFTVKSKEDLETYEEAYFLEKHTNWFANPNISLFKFIDSVILRQKKGGHLRLLDVGCGNGSLLKYLLGVRPSLELHGIDSAPNQHAEIRFIQGDIYKEALKERFDVVTSLMVIEHVGDPRGFMEKIDGWTPPDGLFVLSTNNNGGLLCSLARGLKALGIRVAFDRIYSDHHLQHFTNHSLRLLLEMYGFEVILLKNHNYPMKAVDTPEAGWLIKKFYRAAVWVIFRVSEVLGNAFLQTYVCRKRPASVKA